MSIALFNIVILSVLIIIISTNKINNKMSDTQSKMPSTKDFMTQVQQMKNKKQKTCEDDKPPRQIDTTDDNSKSPYSQILKSNQFVTPCRFVNNAMEQYRKQETGKLFEE